MRLLSVVFKEVHNDRKEANIAPSLKNDKEDDPGKVMEQILLETVSKHARVKEVIGNGQRGVTMGKMSLTFPGHLR